MHHAPVALDLVLLGGGHAHVEVLRRFGMKPMAGVRVTIISREILTPYSGMLPGLVAGHYSVEETHIDLGPLARFAQARLYHDEVIGLDLAEQKVLLRTRPPVGYDILSIDTGSAPSMNVPGALDHAIPVKPVSNFQVRWLALRERVMSASGPVAIGVVGGGAGGVELLMAVRYRLLRDLAGRGDGAQHLTFHLVAASAELLPTHNARTRTSYGAAMLKAGVKLHLHSEVLAIEDSVLVTGRGERIALDEILWATNAAAPAWPAASGLATDAQGFIRVDECLRSISHPAIFAAGDIAEVHAHPRPKAGVFAVRQGPPLATNLRRALVGLPPRAFSPQRTALSLISTGDRYAIASRGSFSIAGNWVWRWKDRIDRRFMARYADLPVMPRESAGNAVPHPALPALKIDPMRCGGCGAKLGAELLHEALVRLRPPARTGVMIGLDRPDDAAVVALPTGTLAVQTVDAFRSFIDDPWLFGRITANHCLNDIFAMGATPQTALAIVTLPLANPGKMREDLILLLTGALDVLNGEHTALVGGHTGEGAELSLGFAINGYAEAGELLRKSGAEVSDALVLTKPLGTGVLLAAAMRGVAKSPQLDAAFDAMCRSNGPAARCLRAYGARAMTDVSGFGLVGHLLEMLLEAPMAATVNLEALPVFEGVVALTRRGILSSLHPENLRVLGATNVDAGIRAHPHFNLCFDPQTAGGLLCALPQANLADALDALRAAGHEAAVIGRFVARDGAESPQILFQR